MLAIEQNSQEWHELRRNKIGASDAAVILGVSPWGTPFSLWEEKLGLRPGKAMTGRMERGRVLEAVARNKLSRDMNMPLTPEVAIHPEHDWMMASLDAVNWLHRVMVEIKCPGGDDHAMALQGKVPEKYYPQLQHQLAVTGFDRAIYYSFDGRDGVVVEVDRDDKYIETLIKNEKAFWECLQSLEAPKLIERDYVKRDLEAEWVADARELVSVKEQIKALKKRDEELTARLVERSEGRNSQGCGIRLSRYFRKGNVDYGAIPELIGVDVESYRKAPAECWRITNGS